MTCPNCSAPFSSPVAVNPNAKPHVGAVMLCGTCAHLSVVEDIQDKIWLVECSPVNQPQLACRLLTEAEFLALDPPTRNDLNFAVRNILAAERRVRNNKIILPSWMRPEL